jgi:hypothetical protein
MDFSKFLSRLGSENKARRPILAHLSLIATCFSIGSLRRGIGIQLVRVLHGAREVGAISGDKD